MTKTLCDRCHREGDVHTLGLVEKAPHSYATTLKAGNFCERCVESISHAFDALPVLKGRAA